MHCTENNIIVYAGQTFDLWHNYGLRNYVKSSIKVGCIQHMNCHGLKVRYQHLCLKTLKTNFMPNTSLSCSNHQIKYFSICCSNLFFFFLLTLVAVVILSKSNFKLTWTGIPSWCACFNKAKSDNMASSRQACPLRPPPEAQPLSVSAIILKHWTRVSSESLQ